MAGGTVISWTPRDRVVPYALYFHKQSWSSEASSTDTTLFAELRCDVRTGVMAVEMVAPMAFQAAVAFKRPRFRRMDTERRLMKYALEQLEFSGSRPGIRDGQQRVEWKVVAPRVGDRYVCVAFTAEGLDEWRKHIDDTSVRGKLRRLFRLRSGRQPVSITRTI
jgi:hypothetical protein